MRCKKAQKLFSVYLLGDISPRQKVLLDEHVDACHACAESISVYRNLFSFISDSPIDDPSNLYFDSLPQKVLSRMKSENREARESLFSPFHFWWKPVSALATAVLVVLVLFRALPSETITPAGTLPDLSGIDQSESYTEFVSSVEHTDETITLDNFETAINGASDTTIWYSDTDTFDSILLFTDEEQEEIFKEIKDKMS